MAHSDARALLVACSNGGSVADWEEFRRRFESRLAMGVRRAFRLSGGLARADEIEDLVQESYCRLLDREARALRRCHGGTEVAIGAYLSRIAERVAIDWLRSATAEKRGGGKVESLEAVAMREGDGALPAIAPQAEGRMLGRERIRRFLACCRRSAGRRGERDLRIMRLALLEGLSSREISDRIGNLISPNGIDTLLHRARRKLAAEGFVVPRRAPLRAL